MLFTLLHTMRATPLLAVIVLLGCFSTGCVHEDWTYRVAHDVQVFASDSTIRPGPLTLVPAEVARSAAAEEAAKSESLSNAALKEKLEQRVKAERELMKVRNDVGEDSPKFHAQKISAAGKPTPANATCPSR